MSKKKEIKTNAMRILEEKGISYQAHQLDLKEAADAVQVSQLLHAQPEQVFKTLVCQGNDHNNYVFMLPANSHLSLKKAAKAAGVKNMEMIPQKTLFALTGYVHGGCSPLGMKKAFPVWIDETAVLYDAIYFSAGKIGVQIEMSPDDLDQLEIGKTDLCEEC